MFTILLVARLGGFTDPTKCTCAHDQKLRCLNSLYCQWLLCVNAAVSATSGLNALVKVNVRMEKGY